MREEEEGEEVEESDGGAADLAMREGGWKRGAREERGGGRGNEVRRMREKLKRGREIREKRRGDEKRDKSKGESVKGKKGKRETEKVVVEECPVPGGGK